MGTSFIDDLKMGEFGYNEEVEDVLSGEGIELRDIYLLDKERRKKVTKNLKDAIRRAGLK